MNRIWHMVLYVVAALLVLGIVLGGAGLLTGASAFRIAELAFGGEEELEAWIRAGTEHARSLWAGVQALLGQLF